MMPQSMRSSNFTPVQWYSSEEWKKVFNLVFEQNGDIACRKEALQIILVWKARCPGLPSAIESTLGLLEVELQDAVSTTDSDMNSRLLRLMYSSVIMRFINHTLDDSQSKRLSLFQAANQLKIPQWVVNLRHETAHGHDLPSLSILKNASKFALNWLYTVYWNPHSSRISDVVTEENSLDNQFENDLNELISLHNLLAVLSHPSFHIVKLCDIEDIEMKETIISDLKIKNVDSKKRISPKMKINVAVRSVIKNIKELLINCKRSCQKDEIFAKIMVGSESLFLTSNNEITGDINKQNKLSKEFTRIWEPLLTLLHSQDMITALVRELISIVENNEESPQKRIKSAQWVKEFAIALFKSKLMMSLPHLFLNNNIKKKQLLSSLVERYPKQKQGLTFSLTHPVPQSISNPEFTNQLFENYTPYLDIYLEPMLQLREPGLPEIAMQKSLELIKIMSSTTINVTCERIYTLYDITNQKEEISNEQSKTRLTDEGGLIGNMEVDQSMDTPSMDPHIGLGKWQRAPAEFDWGKSPIGILPWQMNCYTVNSLLP